MAFIRYPFGLPEKNEKEAFSRRANLQGRGRTPPARFMFFETDRDLPRGKLERTDYLPGLLTCTDGEWQLRGADDRFARMIRNTDGNIGVSKAFFDENNRMRVLDGY